MTSDIFGGSDKSIYSKEVQKAWDLEGSKCAVKIGLPRKQLLGVKMWNDAVGGWTRSYFKTSRRASAM